VIDSQGCVVALGSRSPNLGPGEEPSPMMAAILWPMLARKFAADSGQLTSLLPRWPPGELQLSFENGECARAQFDGAILVVLGTTFRSPEHHDLVNVDRGLLKVAIGHSQGNFLGLAQSGEKSGSPHSTWMRRSTARLLQ
jgi:hypothetical protein